MVQDPTPLNDATARDGMWTRFQGDDWACFDELPAAVRRRIQEHAYDAWAVNALAFFREARRKRASTERAVRATVHLLERCERDERAAFSEEYERRWGAPLPHEAAAATVLRYGAAAPA